MTKKEKIRKDPWQVLITTRRYYDKSDLFILIEPIEGTECFYLRTEGVVVGEHKKIKNYHLEKTNDFFKESMPFKQLQVLIPDEITPHIFDNYEEFLDEITSD